MILADSVVTAEIAVAVVGISWATRSMFSTMFGRKKKQPIPVPTPAPPAPPPAPKDDAILVRQLQQAEDRWVKERAALERVTQNCDECARKLDRVCEMFYRFLDELDEKVLPLLSTAPPAPPETAQAVLLCVRNARTEVREITSQ
jgi:hypothetical protein